MPPGFTCPRCGMTSHSPDDIREGYCGSCRTWIADQPLPSPACAPLTPRTLLTSGLWHFSGCQGDGTLAFTWRPSEDSWARSWTPHASLGAWAVDWVSDRCTLRVAADVIQRELREMAGEGALSYSIRPSGRSAVILKPHSGLSPAPPGTYCCPRCPAEFQVPPGHAGPVLCGNHSPAACAARVVELGAVFDFSAVTARMFDDRVNAAAFELGGRSVEMYGELTPEQADVLTEEIWRGLESGPETLSWVATAVEVWEGCKDAARKDEALADLAQRRADSEPRRAPAETSPDSGTSARWCASDPGDVIL